MQKYCLFIWLSFPEKIRRFFKFALVGGLGSLLSLILLYIFVEAGGVNKYAAWLIGLIIGLASNFILNSIFTWGDRKTSSKKETIRRLTKYYSFYAIIILINYFFYFLFNSIGLYYILSALISIIICSLINFSIANTLIWKS